MLTIGNWCSNDVLKRLDVPMARHFSRSINAAVLVLRVSRKTHFDSPAIIFTMRSATPFNSASISASSRGGLNTFVDLLAMDADGNWVVTELKRQQG